MTFDTVCKMQKDWDIIAPYGGLLLIYTRWQLPDGSRQVVFSSTHSGGSSYWHSLHQCGYDVYLINRAGVLSDSVKKELEAKEWQVTQVWPLHTPLYPILFPDYKPSVNEQQACKRKHAYMQDNPWYWFNWQLT